MGIKPRLRMKRNIIPTASKTLTAEKWKAILDVKDYFDDKIQGDVYTLFPQAAG